jgi:hypothetical protein
VTDDASRSDPTLAHVWDGPGGKTRVSKVVEAFGILYWDWEVTVAPGATVAFISYEVQSVVAGRSLQAEVAQAVAQASARENQSPASLYAGMSAEEIVATMNWPHPPAPEKPTISPVSGANAATPVRLEGSASIAPSGRPARWRSDG